jgi:hypothetical protein
VTCSTVVLDRDSRRVELASRRLRELSRQIPSFRSSASRYGYDKLGSLFQLPSGYRRSN